MPAKQEKPHFPPEEAVIIDAGRITILVDCQIIPGGIPKALIPFQTKLDLGVTRIIVTGEYAWAEINRAIAT